MKNLSRLLIALLLCLCLPAMSASARSDAEIGAMLPAFDSIMRAMPSEEAEYNPRDPEFFWETLYLMAVNWGFGHPLAVMDDDAYELVLPRMSVQEMATALFADYDDLLPVPESMSESVMYDESLDAYRFPLSDAGDTFAEIEVVITGDDGPIVVLVRMKSASEGDEILQRMRFELAPNAYAGGISEPIYLYSIVSAQVL